MPKAPRGTGITPLFSRLVQLFWDVLVFLLRMNPFKANLSLEHFLLRKSPSQTSHSLKQVPTLPQCLTVFLGRVLISSPFLLICRQICASHSYAVMLLASQLKINSLLPLSLGKYTALQSTFGSYCWLLDGCVSSPHWVPNSVIGFSLPLWRDLEHWAHEIEDTD